MTVPPLRHRAETTPVAVVHGGPSAEHDVSIVSGTAIADALAAAGHPVVQWHVDLGGRWWELPPGHRRDGRPPDAYDDPAALGATGPSGASAALERLAAASPPPVVFLALHGPFGEDGVAQALCEAAGLVHTGSGVTASALGMDKALFKRVIRARGLPVADWLEVRADRWLRERDAVLADLDGFARSTGDPRLMVKPARLGSSIGMTLAHDAAERPGALELALRYDDLALVERYLPRARDLEVSVLGNDPERLELHGPGEVRSGREFYDFEAKYTPGTSTTTTRAELDEPLRARVVELAREAYVAIGCEGFARVDFLLAGSELVVSEVNTIPGFTPISLFPALPAAAGYDFTAVCRRVVDLALEREAGRIRRRLRPGDLPR